MGLQRCEELEAYKRIGALKAAIPCLGIDLLDAIYLT